MLDDGELKSRLMTTVLMTVRLTVLVHFLCHWFVPYIRKFKSHVYAKPNTMNSRSIYEYKTLGIWSPLFACNAVVGRMLYSLICHLNAVNLVVSYLHCRVQLCPSSMKIRQWVRNMYLISDVHAVKYMTMQGVLCIRILEMVEFLRFHCHHVRVILSTCLLEEEVSTRVPKTAPVISVWFNSARYLSEVWNGIVAFYFKCVI